MAAVAVATPPGPGRRDSEVINHLVLTDPKEDFAREQARMAEATPASQAAPTPTNISSINHAANGTATATPGSAGDRTSLPRRQDFSHEKASKRETKIGNYILGQTLGEGEFGKVKLGWNKENGVQVAIKLIRREKLDSKARLDKVYREINILRELDHPNIVQLHEMVETEKTIGIILEYASGGELFDYILNEKFLKDSAARRLFAQLVSGVGYLHKKGIIHRDLKLENLLLDRNRNIIITDFGFANTFDPADELGEKVESRLNRRSWVKRHSLEQVQANGFRRGDLMATSCGSPCYAAPELVVSDGIYTGRKVDVWSCGVILYAMLAGYLPFDDDPANPDGDNINLLYKYIVSTPLTFPEYVTPHARDILRRILVPDPRKRADLFEVARHSWLSDYAHVVEFITSGNTTSSDIAKAIVSSDGQYAPPAGALGRSNSVREPVKPMAAVATLLSKHKTRSPDMERSKTSKSEKRNTVQIEYTPPRDLTSRVDSSQPASSALNTPESTRAQQQQRVNQPKTKARTTDTQGPVPVDGTAKTTTATTAASAGPQIPPKPTSAPGTHRANVARSVSDSTAFTTGQIGQVSVQAARPPTNGSATSYSVKRREVPSRGSYGQPLAPAATTASAQGRFTGPPGSSGQPSPQYNMISAERVRTSESSRRSNQHSLPATPVLSQQQQQQQERKEFPKDRRGHRRSTTLGALGDKLFGRSPSISRGQQAPQRREKADRSHPPTSMRPIPGASDVASSAGRPSMDSQRAGTAGTFSSAGGRPSTEQSFKPQRNSRRFSLLHRFGRSTSGGSSEGNNTTSRPNTEGYDGSQEYKTASRPSTRDQNLPIARQYQSNSGSGYASAGSAAYTSNETGTQRTRVPSTKNTNYSVSNPSAFMGAENYNVDYPAPVAGEEHVPAAAATSGPLSDKPLPHRPVSQDVEGTIYDPALHQPYVNPDEYQSRFKAPKKTFNHAEKRASNAGVSSGPARRVMDLFRRRRQRSNSSFDD